MIDMQHLYKIIDALPAEALDNLSDYIQQRRRLAVWVVPPEEIQAIEKLMRPTHELTAKMTDEEINAVIDEELAEVRRERKAKNRY